jgi:hypothetical protein
VNNYAKLLAWKITLFLSTYLHQIWKIINSGQKNIIKYKEYSLNLLNFCMQLKPKNFLRQIVHYYLRIKINPVLFSKH